MDPKETFIRADRRLDEVIASIRDEQWAMTVPSDFAMRAVDRSPTLREVVAYHAYDDDWVPDMLAGRTMAQVGEKTYPADGLGDDPKAAFAAIVDKACAAAAALNDLDRTVHCSFGDFSARDYLLQANYFRGLRSWDIARVIGVDPTIPDDLAASLFEQLGPHAEQYRAIGVFPPEVAVPSDASAQDRLLGMTGRNPG
ncbi:MAG: TIGR03086 family protein [Candidatus Nanopelagicales bacterium]